MTGMLAVTASSCQRDAAAITAFGPILAEASLTASSARTVFSWYALIMGFWASALNIRESNISSADAHDASGSARINDANIAFAVLFIMAIPPLIYGTNLFLNIIMLLENITAMYAQRARASFHTYSIPPPFSII